MDYLLKTYQLSYPDILLFYLINSNYMKLNKFLKSTLYTFLRLKYRFQIF